MTTMNDTRSSKERCEHSPLYTYDSVGIQYRAPCPWCLQLELTRIVAEGAAHEPSGSPPIAAGDLPQNRGDTVPPPACTYENQGSNHFTTGCGHDFWLDDGLDLYDFCPHCGKTIEEVGPETKPAAPEWKPPFNYEARWKGGVISEKCPKCGRHDPECAGSPCHYKPADETNACKVCGRTHPDHAPTCTYYL